MSNESSGARWGCLIGGVLIGCLGAVGAVVLSCAGIIGAGAYSLTHIEPVVQGIELVEQDERVVERLGTPIEAGWALEGEVNVDGDKGYANVRVPISGPKGSGTLRLEAGSLNDNWNFRELVVITGGSRFDVLDPEGFYHEGDTDE